MREAIDIRRAASTLVGRRSTACGSRIPQGSRSRAARWGSASIASAMFLAKQTLTLSGSEKIQDRCSRDLLPPRDWFCVNYRVCLLQNSNSASGVGIQPRTLPVPMFYTKAVPGRCQHDTSFTRLLRGFKRKPFFSRFAASPGLVMRQLPYTIIGVLLIFARSLRSLQRTHQESPQSSPRDPHDSPRASPSAPRASQSTPRAHGRSSETTWEVPRALPRPPTALPGPLGERMLSSHERSGCLLPHLLKRSVIGEHGDHQPRK